MCKKLFKSLFGGQQAAPPTPAVRQEAKETDTGAVVKNSELVGSSGGRETSGRVKLGATKRGQASVAGLSI